MGTEDRRRGSRRRFLKTVGFATAAMAVPASAWWLTSKRAEDDAGRGSGTRSPWSRPEGAPTPGILRKPVPATGERIPIVGMGSWLTFDVLPVGTFLDRRVEVLRRFFDAGGAVIDSSPMYNRSERVIGHCLRRLENDGGLFSATKVWTPLQVHGRIQIAQSEELWGVDRFDLLQIHNMVSWEAHLETLLEKKAAGEVRYIGITTSDGRRHQALERVIAEHPFDFVQLTYNLLDRQAEERLLPLARERGIAVLANRPFRRGALIERLQGRPLPPWAAEIDCASWPQLLLKFIVSHPAVTCAIPATSNPDHMSENMVAAYGRLPDARMRRDLIEHAESL